MRIEDSEVCRGDGLASALTKAQGAVIFRELLGTLSDPPGFACRGCLNEFHQNLSRMEGQLITQAVEIVLEPLESEHKISQSERFEDAVAMPLTVFH